MYTNLIRHLKQQPRHGQAGGENNPIELGSKTIKEFVNALTPIDAAVDAAIDSLGELNKAFAQGLGANTAIKVLELVQTKISNAAKEALILERRNTSLQKSFGLTTTAAAALGDVLDTQSKIYGVSGAQARKYAESIKKMLPVFNQTDNAQTGMYAGMQQSQAILQTSLGLTEDLSNSYTQYAAAQGENAVRTLKASEAVSKFLDPDGKMGLFKQVTEGIAGAGSEIQLQYGKLPGRLELAVIKANKLGLSLENLKGIGDNLLNIESSIGQELEYQLLSGRRLVDNNQNSLTNLYREATIRGDMNKQANVLNQILTQEGETLENNMFARKQMAAMLGMEEKQLASALQKKKILDKAAETGVVLNIDDEGSIADAAAELKKSGQLTAAEFQEFQKSIDTRSTEDILSEMLTIQKEQLIISQITNQKELIKATKDSIINSQQLFSDKLSDIGNKKLTADQLEAIGGAKIGLDILKTLPSILTDMVTTGFQGGPADMGTGVATEIKEDAIIPAGYGSRILSFPEDTLQPPIAFNNNDTIIAGTALTNTAGNTNNNNSNTDLIQFANMIVSAIQQQTLALRDKPGTMNINRFA